MKSTGYIIAIIAVLLMVVAPIAKADEPSAVYKALLVKYDANKDGRLDTAEREIIRTDRLRPQSRERSPRRQFRYPDEVVARFDRNDDNELEGEEFEAARQWVDKRFKEINAEYDADKDGRLNTAERAALSKQIEGGKFKDIGWLTRYLVRSPRSSRGDRNRDMRGGESGQSRGGILRRSDKDGDGRLSERELTVARAALKQFEAELERERRTGIRRVPSRERR
jgi:Ca2+-binding EF-hand superfamily protein